MDDPGQDDSSKQPPTPSPPHRPMDRDPAPPPPWVFGGVDGRILDPAQAMEVEGVRPRSTVYVGPRLALAFDEDLAETLELLEEVADELGWRAIADEDDLREYDSRRRGESSTSHQLGVLKVRLTVADGNAANAPDGWVLLQQARARHGLERLRKVGLDHVILPATEASPFHAGPFHAGPFHAGPFHAGPFHAGSPRDVAAASAAVASYNWPGSGGRQPITYVGPPPHRRRSHELDGRRPVVAIVDTGCANHPWLDEVVDTNVRLDGEPIGYIDPATAPDERGDVVGPLDGSIDYLSGHGTFIAGLVHQACPDADILAWRVVPSEGAIVESALVKVLGQILELVKRHRAGTGGKAIDVLNLSLGYYHETPQDLLYDATVHDLLEDFGRLGVIVVCSAGNEATSRPQFPAAFSPWSDGKGPCLPDTGVVPVVSVGALNPNMTTDAMFSNAGPWVRAYTPGAAVMSTMPAFQGGLQPMARIEAYGRVREAIDPDDYRGGFAVWSGTSFAAPILAGVFASALIGDLEPEGTAVELTRVVRRAWNVVERWTDIRS
jgi:serine protease